VYNAASITYRIGCDVSGSFGIAFVAHLKGGLDIEHGVSTTGAENGGRQIKRVAVGVIFAINGSLQARTCSSYNFERFE
jgi:hypothetical protein